MLSLPPPKHRNPPGGGGTAQPAAGSPCAAFPDGHLRIYYLVGFMGRGALLLTTDFSYAPNDCRGFLYWLTELVVATLGRSAPPSPPPLLSSSLPLITEPHRAS